MENVSNSDPKMSNRELLCLALKVLAGGAEETFVHVDILWLAHASGHTN